LDILRFAGNSARMKASAGGVLLACGVLCCACGGASGTIQLTASGEALALGGYAFPPASADATAFVDGWEVRFSKLLVTVDHITLSENPDAVPTDQSQTGRLVAQLDGPWAVDLHRGGPLTGKGGSDEQAIELGTLDRQNAAGGGTLDAGVRYAFGFSTVPAIDSAKRVALDAADPDYADMIAQGYTVLYIGTATFRGSACTSTDPSFDFTQLPAQVDFRLGFRSPTSYVNCQNPDNDPAVAFGHEEHQRGVQVRANQVVTAQLTVHSDHPFWESIIHDSPAHFDQLAALARPGPDGRFSVSLTDAVGVDFTAFRFNGKPLPWRACVTSYTPPNTAPQMGFDSGTVPHNPSGDPAHTLRDYADFATYNQSTQGHLNSDGLCFVRRGYTSAP
jgi:hypothetical protein